MYNSYDTTTATACINQNDISNKNQYFSGNYTQAATFHFTSAVVTADSSHMTAYDICFVE